jgi:hypothetical protein
MREPGRTLVLGRRGIFPDRRFDFSIARPEESPVARSARAAGVVPRARRLPRVIFEARRVVRAGLAESVGSIRDTHLTHFVPAARHDARLRSVNR